jgi:hypothetical protein
MSRGHLNVTKNRPHSSSHRDSERRATPGGDRAMEWARSDSTLRTRDPRGPTTSRRRGTTSSALLLGHCARRRREAPRPRPNRATRACAPGPPAALYARASRRVDTHARGRRQPRSRRCRSAAPPQGRNLAAGSPRDISARGRSASSARPRQTPDGHHASRGGCAARWSAPATGGVLPAVSTYGNERAANARIRQTRHHPRLECAQTGRDTGGPKDGELAALPAVAGVDRSPTSERRRCIRLPVGGHEG